MQIPEAGATGTVVLMDWWSTPVGQKVMNISGQLTLVKADAFGIAPGSTDRATWALLVEGQLEKVVVLGCQIRGVHFHAPERRVGPEVYVVP